MIIPSLLRKGSFLYPKGHGKMKIPPRAYFFFLANLLEGQQEPLYRRKNNSYLPFSCSQEGKDSNLYNNFHIHAQLCKDMGK